MQSFQFLLIGAFAVFFSACGEKASEPEENPESKTPEEVSKPAAGLEKKPKPAAPEKPQYWSEVKLHEAIREKNPGYTGNGQFQIDQTGTVQAIALDNCGVTDLGPFAEMPLMALYLQGCPVPDIEALDGMPLVELYLENSAVKDLSPLKGMMSLKKLYLSGTIVSDLSPLKGLGITELNLVNTQVTDLSPLAGMPIGMLWLTDTAVSDITPLAKCPLVSLTLHRTSVTDLSPLANTKLQRLHIGETNITDLSPLKGMQLTRLIFDVDEITEGLEVIQQMPSLRELGTKFEDGADDKKHPVMFWQEWSAK